MQSNQGSAPTPPDAAAQAPAAVDALARRRLLLKGLGKGAGAAAALVPIQTLAAPARLCTVSGIQSNVGSGRTGGTTDKCQGHGPAFYATLANWPGYDSTNGSVAIGVGGSTYNQNVPFSTVFGGSTSTGLFAIMQATSTSSEQVWTTALLNALKRNGGTNLGALGYFPYSANEVVGLYNDAGKRAAAEAFFVGFLQNI